MFSFVYAFKCSASRLLTIFQLNLRIFIAILTFYFVNFIIQVIINFVRCVYFVNQVVAGFVGYFYICMHTRAQRTLCLHFVILFTSICILDRGNIIAFLDTICVMVQTSGTESHSMQALLLFFIQVPNIISFCLFTDFRWFLNYLSPFFPVSYFITAPRHFLTLQVSFPSSHSSPFGSISWTLYI